jgi:hypothetical protein
MIPSVIAKEKMDRLPRGFSACSWIILKHLSVPGAIVANA